MRSKMLGWMLFALLFIAVIAGLVGLFIYLIHNPLIR